MLLWISYFIGFGLHVLKRANLSANSPLSQGTRMREFLNRNWSNIFIRFAATTIGFLVWIDPTGYVDRFLPFVGLGKFVGMFPVPHPSPAACAIALAFGLLADWGVDWALAKWAPGLQKELPAIQEQP